MAWTWCKAEATYKEGLKANEMTEEMSWFGYDTSDFVVPSSSAGCTVMLTGSRVLSLPLCLIQH
eukprot:14047136-Ditylum_brightwellii.AAC.1